MALPFFGKRSAWPDSATVVRRALVLRAQAVAALAVPPSDVFVQWTEAQRQPIMEAHATHSRQTQDWLQASGAWDEASVREKYILSAPLDKFAGQMFLDALWSAESAACMIWALGYLDELPPYDTQVASDVFTLLPDAPAQEMMSASALRDRDELSRHRGIAELWHWRSRTRQLQEDGKLNGPVASGMAIDDVIRAAAERAAANGAIPAPLGGDFPVLGKPYREASADEWASLTSIAMERHKALNWLCGMAPRNGWDETPTDT